MSQVLRILILPGDGIGPEVAASARSVLEFLKDQKGLAVDVTENLIGGAAIDQTGNPLPRETLDQARESHAVLLAAVGGPQWDTLSPDQRPEKGLLQIRQELELYANLRPVRSFPGLENSSSLKPEILQNLDVLILRELTGGIYFGQPRSKTKDLAVNTMIYSRPEIERMTHLGFQMAFRRKRNLTSVDKANVLETSQLWREVVNEVHKDYEEIALQHMYIDNCAMQLIHKPSQFDVILTSNLFGDILSDEAAMLSGSIGLLPSASLGDPNQNCRGLFEPVHGSAPDIAGKDLANPLAMLLSLAMLFRHAHPDLDQGPGLANGLEDAIAGVLKAGWRTADIQSPETPKEKIVGTQAITQKVIENLT